ncbi:phosphotransferase [Stella sp.]|uniref:phosphotransferase n=1 Tax=Stella sp. TaxID=2912054 RepID=UPI0035B29A46
MVGAPIVRAEPVSGGLANTNLRIERADADQPILLRIYRRDPAQAGKEARLHALMGGRAPVPRFLDGPRLDPATGETFAVLEWMPGERLEQLLPRLDAPARAALGRAVGTVLASVHAIAFDRSGFFGADLGIGSSLPGGAEGLVGFLRRCLLEGPGGARLGAADTRAALAFAAAEGDRLAAGVGRAGLVHGDFNGSNILVADGRVTALLDWEFAFAGSPAFDFGNLLRPPAGLCPAFVAGLAEGYAGAGGLLPPDWRRLAAIADLYSWADFLARPDAGDALARDAAAAIRATIAAPCWDESRCSTRLTVAKKKVFSSKEFSLKCGGASLTSSSSPSGSPPENGTVAAPHRVPGHLARRFYQVFVGVLSEVTASAGLLPLEYAALASLDERRDLDQKRLAEHIGIDTTSVRQVIEGLEAKGLLDRRVDPADRRARILQITPTGEDLRRRVRPLMLAAQDRILSALSGDERAKLIELLLRVVETNASYARPGIGRRRPRKRSSATATKE